MRGHGHTGDAAPPVSVGEVTSASGTLVVIDAGYLALWCHDRPPNFPAGFASEETVRLANSAVDLAIEGPDAEQAGRLFDRQWHPRFLYDIPRQAVAELQSQFAEFTTSHGLSATLRPLDEQVPHRQRVDAALRQGDQAGEVTVHGVWASAVAGVPTDRPLSVLAEHMPDGPYADRWRRVFVECLPREPVARSLPVGYVGVDYARLLFADVDALGHWRHEEPLDGRADFLFWGRDAARAASLLDAPACSESEFGWIDRPVEEVARLGRRVEELRAGSAMKFATDYRPHSYHHQLMEPIRSSPSASGSIVVGGCRVCGLMTSWGDGIFGVFRDLAADGRLVRVRVELGTPERVALMESVERRWRELSKYAVASRRVVDDGLPVLWLYREPADREGDSGWRVFAGDESQEYLDDADNAVLVRLQDLCEKDRRLEDVFSAPVGSAYERSSAADEFRPVEGFVPPED